MLPRNTRISIQRQDSSFVEDKPPRLFHARSAVNSVFKPSARLRVFFALKASSATVWEWAHQFWRSSPTIGPQILQVTSRSQVTDTYGHGPCEVIEVHQKLVEFKQLAGTNGRQFSTQTVSLQKQITQIRGIAKIRRHKASESVIVQIQICQCGDFKETVGNVAIYLIAGKIQKAQIAKWLKSIPQCAGELIEIEKQRF